MIKVICSKCNAVRDINSGTLINLWCHICNGTEEVSFDRIVQKRCHTCGYAEVVQKGKKTKVYHSQKPGSVRHDLQFIDDLSEIKIPKPKKKVEPIVEEEQEEQIEKDEEVPTRRPTKRTIKKAKK